jgi:hypothetical protein
MNIKSIFSRIGSCCGSTKKEAEKKLNPVVEDNKTDFPED